MNSLLVALALLFSPEILERHLGDAAIVITNVETGEVVRRHPEQCAQPEPPCSTFKIWNTAIGLETGVLTRPDELFYKWDGKKRWLDAWNQDLTLKQAFAVSAVPAYQELARKIGPERMQTWIGKLDYGDKNLAAGLDVFWLPGEGRKPLLISPDRQVELLTALATGKSPFSENTVKVLREVMEMQRTEKGTLYAKTGTGIGDAGGTPAIGWYVGFVESTKGRFAFAAILKEPAAKEEEPAKLLGPELRKRVEAMLTAQGVL